MEISYGNLSREYEVHEESTGCGGLAATRLPDGQSRQACVLKRSEECKSRRTCHVQGRELQADGPDLL